MKLINEKGKLFGIINIIDLVVLLVVILIAGAAGYKLLGNKIGNATGTGSGLQNVIVTVRCSARNEVVSKALKQGDQLISLTSKVDAYIDSVSVEAAEDEVTTADGRRLMVKSLEKKDVVVKIKMSLNTGSAVKKIGSQDVAIGSSFRVKTENADLPGLVEGIEIK